MKSASAPLQRLSNNRGGRHPATTQREAPATEAGQRQHVKSKTYGFELTSKTTQVEGKSMVPAFGHYEVIHELSTQGNMGKMYRVKHTHLDRICALKAIQLQENASPDKEKASRTRFDREAKALAKVTHPNVVKVFDYDPQHSTPYLVMEFIEGVDLLKTASGDPNSGIEKIGTNRKEHWAVEQMISLCQGLMLMHEKGLVHRDIKPENILVRADDAKAVIVDLGLAHIAGQTITQAGQLMGTLAYMAPEQFKDASKVTSATDVYGLACTMFHILSGTIPFPNHIGLPGQMAAHLHEPRPRLIERCSYNVSEPLSQMLEEMMAIEAHQRPPLKEVVKRLEELQESFSLSIAQSEPSGRLSFDPQELILILESSTEAPGTLRDRVASALTELSAFKTDEILSIFSEAAKKLGPRKNQSSTERGFVALVQIYLETQNNRLGYQIGLECMKQIPSAAELAHFCAAAAQMIDTSSVEEREFFLREAIRLEEQALAFGPHPSQSASLSVQAQCTHKLAMICQNRGDRAVYETLIQRALSIFEKSLQKRRPVLRLALYAEALADSGDIKTASVIATEACETDWFLWEAQQIYLRIANKTPETRMTDYEMHLRLWSIVASTYPGTQIHRKWLTQYCKYLERKSIWPELLQCTHSLSSKSFEDALYKTTEKYGTTFVEPKRTQVPIGPTNIQLEVWEYESHIVCGHQGLMIYGLGKSAQEASRYWIQLFLDIAKRLRKSKYGTTPQLIAFVKYYQKLIGSGSI